MNLTVLSRRSIEEALSTRSNSLNFIRLVLASAVIVSHSFPIGGFGSDPRLGDMKLGTWAVGGFFCISGYLISRSAERSTKRHYFRARALRILPGLWVCALITAFVLAPTIGALNGDRWTAEGALRYAFHTMTFTNSGNMVDKVPQSNPVPAINGSLWTLTYEVLCYVGVATMAYVKPLWNRWVSLSGFVVSIALAWIVLGGHVAAGSFIQSAVYLIPFFLAGSVLYRFRGAVPFSTPLAALSVLFIVVFCSMNFGTILASGPTAYLIMWMGARLGRPFRQVGVPNDVSYGLYVYAFPMQQLLASIGANKPGVAAFAVLGILATLPLAIGSWHLIEKPAMRMVRRAGAQAAATVR